jgi:3-methyladenine DNA glycosylase AlkD
MTVRSFDNERIAALPNIERSRFSEGQAMAEMTVTEYDDTSDQRTTCPKPAWNSASIRWRQALPRRRYVPLELPRRSSDTQPTHNKLIITVERIADMSTDHSADQFVKMLEAQRSPEEAEKIQRYFKHGEGDTFIGVRMGQVFMLAKAFIDMPPSEIEKLLESPIHEVRAGALSIMDKQARRRKTPERRRKELFELYLRRHDRINNWDLVDLGAPYVIGGYLFDKPRDILYTLAHSQNIWERRTAIVSTYYFIRAGDVADTFNIAELLLNDDHDLIHKATGGWLREAGKKDPQKLVSFLDHHAATMPRVALRYATEHLDKEQRDHYLGMKKAG